VIEKRPKATIPPAEAGALAPVPGGC
jgi:hypothetical protein